tara:strand:- start:268 stop:1188 length:921 start_codon:yes stop_codon:yes gene_type:complete
MKIYILHRIIYFIPTVWLLTTIVFFGIHFSPGDPASITLGLYASDETIAALRQELGLDKNIFYQYFDFLGKLVQGDLGKSYHNETAVIELIITAFLPTIILVSVSLSFAVIIGGLIGTISAVYENTYIDSFARVLAVVGVSVPIFWAAIMFIIFFSVFLNWLPVAGFGTVSHLVLPALALSGQSMAFVARLFRSNLIEEKRQDYVRTARSKGISEKRIWIHHIFRNSLLSIVTLIGIRFGTLIGGAVIVENVFAWPGLGSLILTAVNSRDYPVILGSVIWIAILVMIVNLIVDILYTVLDPKIGYK